MAKMPFLQFFPSDWLSDECLSTCSLAARGLWIHMLCLMHKNVRRGYLSQGDKALTLAQLARTAGVTTEEAATLVQELETSGVTACNEHGIIYSRRMVRDEALRLVRSEAGRKGGAVTGDLLKQKSKQKSSKPLVSDSGVVFSSEEENAQQRAHTTSLEGVQGEDLLKQKAKQKSSETWRLSELWAFHTRRTRNGCRQDLPIDAEPIMEAILAAGVSASAIEAAIRTRPDNTEYLWQFKKRLTGATRGVSHDGLKNWLEHDENGKT
ncbi:MAG TPA: hypothetical protein VG099_03760 [Gemmataceae bacterium]|jgi:hypothetical protein|nr:hypothetical protein [Gemmataceae bacterium]